MGPVERLKLLREVLAYVEMSPQRADFSSIAPSNDLPKREKDVNTFIRERTRFWRKSYLIPKLEAMIQADEEKLDKRRTRVPNIFD